MSWTTVAPWKPILGSGQSKAFTSGASATFTNAVGARTHAIYISAITANCLVKLATAATATTDLLVKSTDGPTVIGCSPGDVVSVWGLGAGTAYLCELTH